MGADRFLPATADSVRKDFVLEFTVVLDEEDVEFEFRDVNAKCWFCHDGQLLWHLLRRRSNLQMQAQLQLKRLWILSDLSALALLCGCRELF